MAAREIKLDVSTANVSAKLDIEKARTNRDFGGAALSVSGKDASGEIDIEVNAARTCAALEVEPAGRPIPMNAEQVRVIYDSPYPEYRGTTEVTPQVIGQTLPTHNTLLKKDITIAAIPYYETTNLKGGYTAIIGG